MQQMGHTFWSKSVEFRTFLLGLRRIHIRSLGPWVGAQKLPALAGPGDVACRVLPMRTVAVIFLTFIALASLPVAVPAQEGAAPPVASGSGDTSPNYLIGPGDTLQVFVWRNPELTVTVPVRPDGKITTPLVQDMVAVGKTPSQLARDIEKVLAEFIRTPQVNVILSNPVSAFSQVKVIGQVTNPQSLPFREGMRVLDAVLAAGGLGQFAAGNRAKIVRKENGKEIEIKVMLENLINKGDMKHNHELRAGDILVVPESLF
jgi:polysaccharide export outer membrane protein